MNGIEFGNEGQLYIQIGGSTNAGVPGRLTTNRIQKEGVLSAATLVAHNITGANFSGKLTYDADDDGNLNPGYDVEVFAHGNRNPYDLVSRRSESSCAMVSLRTERTSSNNSRYFFSGSTFQRILVRN